MASKSPLRDRLLSNSPDPVKNSILRESGLGWNSPPPDSATSPLRISKRDSSCSPMRPNQLPVPRRTSSSFKHVTTNNLVSKSPFKSQIPTSRPKGPVPLPASPRRVSGEKRQRPSSLHEQEEAENDRPFSLKRERRQSKTFQAIIHNEPVSKSPFRRPGSQILAGSRRPISSPLGTPLSSNSSPTRSSLVTRRLHGPRLSGEAKRDRRKTVTFDENMDVMEFERSSIEEHVFDSDEEDVEHHTLADEEGEGSNDIQIQDDPFDDAPITPEYNHLDFDEDISINGLVEEMMNVTSSREGTPTSHDIPTDLDTEDGIPFGHSHHAERSREFHEQERLQPHPSPPSFSLHESNKEVDQPWPLQAPGLPYTPPSTPPLRDTFTSPPLGRSTHAERIHEFRQHELEDAGGEMIELDVEQLPPSPSVHHDFHTLCQIPESPRDQHSSADPFVDNDESQIAAQSEESNFNSARGSSMERKIQSEHSPMPHSASPLRRSSPFSSPRRAPLPPIPDHLSSETTSPSPNGRTRITREDVQRRLLTRRSIIDSSPRASPSPTQSSLRQSQDDDVSLEVSLPEPEQHDTEEIPSVPPTMEDSIHEFGMPQPSQRVEQLKLDFGSKFGHGGLGIEGFDDDDSFSFPLSPPKECDVSTGVDMDMRSALDRLMEDVAGTQADDSIITDEYDDAELDIPAQPPRQMERAATDSALLCNVFTSRDSGGMSLDSQPPTPPPKDNIRNREQVILEKRREIRRLERDDFGEDVVATHFNPVAARTATDRRPSRRRSKSASDIKEHALNLLTPAEDDGDLVDSIQKELQKMSGERTKKYLVRQRGTIYASSRDSRRDQVSHMSGPGDVNSGKAWKAVKRPSDMNEYAKQIKELRAQDKTKAHGKVFVRVLGIKGMHLPIPKQPTTINCTLNNGIHYVTTPDIQLDKDCRVDQEFELIEHNKLEFTLTLKVKRDPHIVEQFKALTIPPPVAAPIAAVVPSQSSSRSGMRGFFSSSPKKSKDKVAKVTTPPAPLLRSPLPENLARYLRPDNTVARAFVTFKDIASHCDTRIFETSFPLMGQRTELNGKPSILQVGEMILQIFRLPPLPGIGADDLPQSLEECHRGLRHVNWHKVTYFEGTLTQNGGDCTSWRRRQFRVIGSKLVAFNDVTKRVTASIDLKEAITVEDHQDFRHSQGGSSSQLLDDDDALYGVERAFRLTFPGNEDILFFADTDEEKAKWLDVLRALVGHIPHLPVWAEYLWQLQNRPASGNAGKVPLVA